MAKSVFNRPQNIGPSQFRAVADRRFDDATALCDTGQNARANGAQYLVGIVIDVLLKAQLMRRYPDIARKRPHEVAEQEREIWSLIWRSHDLERMLRHLPGLLAGVAAKGERAGKPYLDWLLGICAAWTIHIRYSPYTTTVAEAKHMLERVRELKEILK